MGLLDLFKKKYNAGGKGVDENTFYSNQFQTEVMAFALWKHGELGGDYAKVKNELLGMGLNMNPAQADEVINNLKLYLSPLDSSTLQVGQLWKYNTRAKEPNSRVAILKIETLKGQEAIHITLSNVDIANPKSETGKTDLIEHLPVTRAAFMKSVTELEANYGELPLPDGYHRWRTGFDEGQAGIFDLEIKEILTEVEGMLGR